MFRTLRSRLVLTYVAVTLLVVLLISGGLVLALARGQLGNRLVYLRLHEIGARVTQEMGGRLAQVEPVELQLLAERLGDRFEVRVLFVGQEKQVLADSLTVEGSSLCLPDDFSVQQAYEGVFYGEQGGNWRFIGLPAGTQRSILLAARSPIVRVLIYLGNEIRQPVLRIGILALALSVLLAYIVSSSLVRPLRKMNQAMQRIAGGNFEERLPLEGPLEMQTAARAFNNMAQQVQASQALERDFVANVSHELKTPLTSIQGYAQAILDGTADDEGARKKAAGVIADEAHRLHRLVLDLLDLARFDSGRVQFKRLQLDPVILLENTIEKFRIRSIQKGIMLESELDALPVMVGDGDRLAQVFTNLMDNAIKHTPEGNSVRVEARAAGSNIEICVSDQGEGIPFEDLSRIFDRFYQVDKSRKRRKGTGSGLGLAISKEIIEAHRGLISVESTLGEGSTFTVILPIIQPWDETLVQSRQDSGLPED